MTLQPLALADADLVSRAAAMARSRHRGQVRKYSGAPYIVHPERVVYLVSLICGDPVMLAAAWLHDVVEDTDATIYDIESFCGAEVADLVWWLSDISKPEDGNRAARKAIDRQHIAEAPAEAQTVKVADLIDNTRSIARWDPHFARTYLQEKNALLEVLTRADRTLVELARGVAYKAVCQIQEHGT